jgi:hypothetical protein
MLGPFATIDNLDAMRPAADASLAMIGLSPERSSSTIDPSTSADAPQSLPPCSARGERRQQLHPEFVADLPKPGGEIASRCG